MSFHISLGKYRWVTTYDIQGDNNQYCFCDIPVVGYTEYIIDIISEERYKPSSDKNTNLYFNLSKANQSNGNIQ